MRIEAFRSYQRPKAPVSRDRFPSPVRQRQRQAEAAARPRRRTRPRISDSTPAPVVGGQMKRCFDVVAAVCLLLLLAPLMALVAAAIKFSDGGPVFFRHNRIGWNGRRFHCLKFRTMRTDSEQILGRLLSDNPEAAQEWAATHKLKHDPRVTALGAGLRKSSVDELPQLLNVLKGDMSLVGPRPIVEAELPKYSERVADYLSARPGITGLWQVSGRNDVDYDHRVQMDSQYVRNWTVWKDLSIIIHTLPAVLGRRGCY